MVGLNFKLQYVKKKEEMAEKFVARPLTHGNIGKVKHETSREIFFSSFTS